MNKTWKLVIGIEAFYLTEQEKNFYMSSLAKGAKFVQVNDKLTLGTNFQSLQHEEVMGEREEIERGKWKCEYGRWHSDGWECNCMLTFDEKTQAFIKKPDTEIVKN